MIIGANPVLKEDTFLKQPMEYGVPTMTVNGTVYKTLLLLGIMLIPAFYFWTSILGNEIQSGISIWVWVGMIGGFITAIITSYSPKNASITAPIYALCQGVFLGSISAYFEQIFPGISMQALLLTSGILLIMLGLYKGGVIKPTAKFKAAIFAATGAIALFYFAQIILSLFGIHILSLHSGGLLGIGINLAIVVIASLSLIINFDFIDNGQRSGAPLYM